MLKWADLADEVDGEKEVYFRLGSSLSTLQQVPKCCELLHDFEQGQTELISDPLHNLLRAANAISRFDVNANPECSLNLFHNSCNVAISSTTTTKLNLEHKKLFADFYLRYRHEFFHNLVCNYLNLGREHSDVRFCDCTDLSSKRTPDNIIIKGDEIHIIEVTVSTDYEKSLFKKGSEQHGYIPKYVDEISELRLLGKKVSYHILIWDMSRLDGTEYIQVLHTLLDVLEVGEGDISINAIENFRKDIMLIHSRVVRNFSGEMSLVLSSKNQITLNENDLSNISNLLSQSNSPYASTYTRLTISPDIHTKLMSVFERLPTFLNRFIGARSLILVFNIMNSKFFFEKEPKLGVSYDHWSQYLKSEDYISVLLCTYIRAGGKLKESHKYDSGVDYFILQSKTENRLISNRSLTNYVYRHVNTGYGFWDEYNVNFETLPIFKSAYFDENYDELITQRILDLDKSHDWSEPPQITAKTLSGCVIDEKMQVEALLDYRMKLCIENEFNHAQVPPKVYAFKNSFIYPIVDSRVIEYCSYRDKPTQFIINVRDILEGQNYTVEILNKTLGIFEFGSMIDPRLLTSDYQEMFHKRAEANSAYYQHLKILANSHNLTKAPRKEQAFVLSDKAKVLHQQMVKANKEFNEYMSLKNLPRQKLPLIKISTKPKTVMHDAFNREMAHFKEKKSRSGKDKQMSNIKGYGNGNRELKDNLKEVNALYENLVDFMLGPSLNKAPDNFIDTHVAEDASFMELLKNEHINKKKQIIDFVRQNNLANVTCFISRLCHTLMYYSQCSFSSEYVAVDNLGHSNVLLIVKGGKKIFKTKASKLFRVIYPIPEEAAHFVSDGKTTSYSIRIIKGKTYCITPWITLHEAHIAEGIAMHHKISGFLMMNLREHVDRDRLRLLMFNVMLAIHGRRSTEELLHGVRYFIANNLGTHSNLVELMPSFSGFNRDMFQFMIRSNLSENYLHFSKQIKSWQDNPNNPIKHIFCDATINTPEDMTFLIYSTYLMTKAPITQASEQVKNLTSIVKIHKEVKSIDKSDFNTCLEDLDYITYSENLFKHDMKLDLKLCSTIGKFCADYITSKNSESKILSDWESVVNKGWQTLANTKGLRGRKKKGEFFGEKGYYVALEDITAQENFNECLNLIMSDESETVKRKKIFKMNETYRMKMRDGPNELNYHAVDKRQRGGGREIYVMDLITKIHQQPIESFLKKLCKLMPNEVISIPSNKRAHFVHSRVFEKVRSDLDNDKVCFLTLDCRKWAPKSSLEKYVVFIASMSEVLPDEFMRHFMRFFNLMFTKKLVTRKPIYEIYVGSEQNSENSKYFTVIDDRAEMEMDYSFMMGIFNYLSSLMHAANQIYASHMINKTSKMSFQVPTDLTLLCHSDDSAGKIIAKDDKMITRCLFLYEVLLKGCNHLLSIKKSSVSTTYFEFLSILYYKNKLLPLLPKFLSGINFRPSDKGYSSDVISSLNRSNELVLNGSTFDNAYLSIKVQSHLIWKFYFNKDPEISDYSRPIQLLGMPDPHPLSSMISGSDSELIRIYVTKGDEHFNKVYRILTALSQNFDSEESMMPALMVKNPVIVTKPLLKNLINEIKTKAPKFADSWTVSNVNFRNTYLEAVQIALKCQDRTFVSAMQDEELTRRISRSYHYRTTSCINTVYGALSYKMLRKIIDELMLYLSGDIVPHNFTLSYLGSESGAKLLKELDEDLSKDCPKVISTLNIMHGEYIQFLRYMDKINVKKIKTEIRHNTCKPVHMLIQKTTQPLVKIPDVASLVSYMKEPENRAFLPDLTNLPTLASVVDKYFNNLNLSHDDMSSTLLYKIINKLNSNMSKEFYFYSNLPSNSRNITNYHELCTFLAHNSFPGEQILGISLYFPNSVHLRSPEFIASMMTPDFKLTTAFTSLCFNILREEGENFQTFKNLKVRVDSLLGQKKLMTISETMLALKEKWSKNTNAYNFISPYIEMILGFCKDRFSFDHSGKFLGDFSFLNNTHFYCYLKKQKLVGNKWMGDAVIYVRSKSLQVIFEFGTVQLKAFRFMSDKGPIENVSIDYLNYVLRENGMRSLNECLMPNPDRTSTEMLFGMDEMGVFQFNKSSNLEFVLLCSVLDPKIDKAIKFGNVHSCKIVDDTGIQFESGDEMSERTNFKLNFIKLDISYLQDLMVGTFVEIDENKLILNDISGPLMENFRYYILRKMGLDLYVDFEDLLKNFTNSKIYRLMHYLENRGLLPDNEERRPVYPGQPGGLLNLLLKAKETGFDIDIMKDSILTTHMLNLRSNNPESYLSTIYENIEVMYEKLYSPDMKLAIGKDLQTLYDALVNGRDQDEKMQQLLRKWGLLGIEGHLMSYRVEKSTHFFDYFYVEGCNKSLSAAFGACLPRLFNYMKETFSKNKNQSRKVLEILGLVPEMSNYKDLMRLFNSAILIYSYTLGSRMFFPYLNYPYGFMVFYNMIEVIMQDEDSSETFNQLIKSDELLSVLPVSPDHIKQWWRVLTSLMNSYLNNNRFKHLPRLNIGDKSNALVRENYISLGGDRSMTGKIMRYGGIYSPNLMSEMTHNITVKMPQKYYHFKPYLGQLSQNYFKDVGNLIAKAPLNEDALDTDEYMDLKLEFVSKEPDLDYMLSLSEDLLENVPDPYVYHVTIGNERVSAKVAVVHLMGYSGMDVVRHIRQICENIILISDSKIELPFGGCHTGYYKARSGWEFPILCRQSLIFHLICNNEIATPLAEAFLLDPFTPAVNEDVFLINLTYKVQMSSIEYSKMTPSEAANFTDKMEDAEKIKLEDMLNETSNMDVKEKEEAIKAKVSTLYNELVSRGISEDLAKSVDAYMRLSIKGDVNMSTLLQKLGEDLAQGEGMMNVIMNFAKGTITSGLKNKEAVEDVLQVPLVFREGVERSRGQKNRALNDQVARAEINVLSTGVADRVFSGNLVIDEETLEELLDIMDLCNSKLTDKPEDYNKKAMLMFIMFFINDAQVIKEKIKPSDAEVWSNVRKRMVKTTSRRKSPLKSRLTVEPGSSMIKYNAVGGISN